MHPVLLRIGPVTLHSYGAMLGLSFVVGWHVTLALARRDGLDVRALRQGCLWVALCALLGARLLFVITNPGLFPGGSGVMALADGGVVAYGGFLGGLAGAAAFARLRGLGLLAWADCLVPALCTGLLLTRVGCFLAGCDFGRPWDGPWAVVFPSGSPAHAQQVAGGLLSSGAARSLPVHPTQLYESASGALLLPLAFWARRRRANAGMALAVFAAGYASLRFGIETVRGDGQRGQVEGLSTSQLIALVTFLIGVALALRLTLTRRRRDPDSRRLAAGPLV